MADTADVIIIGGGIAGASAGAALAMGGARVVLLEAEDAVGRHATGRSAAMFILNYGGATVRALNAASEAALAEPDPEIAETSLLSARGELVVASEAEGDALDAYLAGANSIEEVSRAEALRLCPVLRPEACARAAVEPGARDIDVDRLLQGCLRSLRRRSGQVLVRAGASRLSRDGAGWRVETGRGPVCAPVVVNAAGAWADGVAQAAGLPGVGLTPLRRSAAILPAPEGHDVSRWPLVAAASETWYARPDAGRLMVSPADEDPVEPHDAFADDLTLAAGLHRFEQATTVAVTRVERTWAGLRTFAPDRTPVAGFDPLADGFFWLAGQGGYGVQTAPAMARLAADLILNRPPSLDAAVIAALSPARFRTA